jgi:hypothetical protein
MRPEVPRLPLLFTIRVAAVTLTWLANAVDDAVVTVIGSGGADVDMRGDGRDCPMRVDAPEAGSCTPMIGEGLRAVCLQRVDEGRARAKRLRESGFTKMARSPGRHSPLGPRGITGPVGVGLGCHSPAARAGVLAR